jgi:ATP-dependent DNA helicase RecG
LQDWPQIQFIDDREAYQFTTCIERLGRETSINKGALKVQIASRNAPLSELQEEILKIIGEDPSILYETLTTKLNKDRTTIMRNIQKLKDSGILHRVGSKKTGHWKISQ